MKTTVPRVFSFIRSLFFSTLFISSVHSSFGQNIDFGKSYINVTKGLNGGTIETGDILEIRASLVVRSGTYDSCRFQDAVPVGTTFISGSIKVLTNEGKTYKAFTDAYGDDCGWITGLNITIHLGFNTAAAPATAFRRGRVANTHKPSFYGSTCIMIASYRVTVTSVTYTTINTGGGNITYKNGINALQFFTFPANSVMVYPNYGICANTVGTNAIGTETNGTFGSGKPRNRGASLNVPVGYTYNIFTSNTPNDYFYGIANNTSTNTGYTILNTWPKPDGSVPTHRVFQVWDIIGDHTGAASPTLGNPAADTVANPNAGYMLIINAAYRIDSAFQQTITGLCPNTYYEVSCWMRNICSKCGCDSNGVGASGGAGYIPTAAGDSSGVYPNLTFELDGIDYYTTGNLLYSGLWVKKGFTYLTGMLQTSFTMKYKNNAPGGGGNDWTLDDISIATCSPNMRYSPSLNPTVCDSNTIVLRDTVRSFFNNYTYYKWQWSTNGGASWTDVTPPSGPSVPFWNGTAWEYVSSYTVPISQTTVANNGDLYRLVVATTIGNLSDVNCRFTDGGNITLTVIDCGIPLATELLSFIGRISNERAVLKWTTSSEAEPLNFDVEKSYDGSNYSVIATVESYNDYTSELNTYSFTDPEPVTGKVYYRIKMRNDRGQNKSSRTLQLSILPNVFSFVSVINPFSNQLSFEVSSDKSGKAEADLIDQLGKVVKKMSFDIPAGISNLSIDNTGGLSTGIYILRIQMAGNNIQKRVMKQNK